MFNEQVLQIAERIRGLRMILDISVSEMASACSTTKVTTFCAPTTIYRFFIKEDLPKTISGKIRRFEIRNNENQN